MKRYEKYKPSGIEWLGEIPEHWELKRIKDIFKEFGSGTTPSTSVSKYYDEGTINWLNTTDLNNDIVYDTKQKITRKALVECGLKIYPENSLAIAMYGQGKTRGTVGLLKIPSTTNQAACIMYKPLKTNTKYILYWFVHKYGDIRGLNTGATQPNMNQDFVKFLTLQFPSFFEQITIANYLDTKTTAIDRKIELLTAKTAKYKALKTAKYKALRRSLINETVCRGLNPNVPLKDSGIEWIGEIPEQWEVKRVKELFDISRGRVISQEELIDVGKYPVYSSQTENNGCLGYINSYDFNATLLTWTTDGANAGTVFKRTGKFNCTNVCGLLKPKRQNFNLDFILYVLQISASHNKRIDTNGAKIMSNEMSIIPLIYPPIDEQTTIATYLDAKTTQIDTILTNIGEQITKLTQLRKTLINDVVTGKIKVTE